MKSGEFRIDPIKAAGRENINGVWVTDEGAWLGEIVEAQEGPRVEPYKDPHGNYIPAPDHWQCLIVKQLR